MNHHQDRALKDLLRVLATNHYRFTTITPASHQRVLRRHPDRIARNVSDVLGWSLPFHAEDLPELAGLLDAAGMLDGSGALCRSRIRVSSLREELFVHSAYPTDSDDAVFFGPDSYRFADAICREIERRPLPADAHILDIGTGAGVAAVVAGKRLPAASIHATDINQRALEFARISASQADVPLVTQLADGGGTHDHAFDLILINPPYIIDAKGRQYRDGGGAYGGELAVRLVGEALPLLGASGRLLLYTGSAIVAGSDPLLASLETLAGVRLDYREIDPDVFGEELANPMYREVERIALVTATFTRMG